MKTCSTQTLELLTGCLLLAATLADCCIQGQCLGNAEVAMSSAGFGVPTNPFNKLCMHSKTWTACCSNSAYLEARDWPDFNAMHRLTDLAMIHAF